MPTYQVVEMIRKEEQRIAKEKLAVEKNKTKTAQDAVKSEKDKTKAAKEQTKAAKKAEKLEKQRREKLEHVMAITLFDKGIDIDTIAKIMEITPKTVEKIIGTGK